MTWATRRTQNCVSGPLEREVGRPIVAAQQRFGDSLVKKTNTSALLRECVQAPLVGNALQGVLTPILEAQP